MNEKLIERKLFNAVKKMKGMPLKLASPWHNGKTDRLLIMPKGKVWFVEVKTTGKRLDPLQEVFFKELRKRGQNMAFIDDQQKLDELLNRLRNDL